MSDNSDKPVETGLPAEADKATADWTPEQRKERDKQMRDEIKKFRLKAEALEAELSERNRKQAEAEAKLLQEQGQFKLLYEKKLTEAEQLAQQAKRAEPYVEAFRKTLDQRIERIPETNRSLVPKFDDPLKTSEWLDENEGKLGARPFPNLNPGAGSPSGTSGGNGASAGLSTSAEYLIGKLKSKVPEDRLREKFKGK